MRLYMPIKLRFCDFIVSSAGLVVRQFTLLLYVLRVALLLGYYTRT